MSVFNRSTILTQAEVLIETDNEGDTIRTMETIYDAQCFNEDMYQNILDKNNFQSNPETQSISESFDITENINNQTIDELSDDEMLTEENLDFPPMTSIQGKHVGSTRYIWSGYIYARDGYSQTFRCSKRERYRCPGRAKIKNGIVHETKEHSHPREPHILPIEIAKQNMLLRAQLDRSLRLRTIYHEACETEPLVASHLSLKMMLNKMKKVRCRRPLPSFKSHIEPVKKLNLNTALAKDWLEIPSRDNVVARCKICKEDIIPLTKVRVYNHQLSKMHNHAMTECYRSSEKKCRLKKIGAEAQLIPAIDLPKEDNQTPKISVHVRDPDTSCNISRLGISLHRLDNNAWYLIGNTNTDEFGKCILSKEQNLTMGLHKLNVDTRPYYSLRNQKCLYPYIEIAFNVESADELYHFFVQLSSSSYNVCRL